MGIITMLDGFLRQLDTAETQEQFDQALQGAIIPIGLLMMQSIGKGIGAPKKPVAPSASFAKKVAAAFLCASMFDRLAPLE